MAPQLKVILFLLGVAATLSVLGVFRRVAAFLVFTAFIGVLLWIAEALGVDHVRFMLGVGMAFLVLLLVVRLWMGDRWDDGPPK